MPRLIKQITDIAENNKYDILQISYWFQGELIKEISLEPFFSIDTLDVLFEKKEK